MESLLYYLMNNNMHVYIDEILEGARNPTQPTLIWWIGLGSPTFEKNNTPNEKN